MRSAKTYYIEVWSPDFLDGGTFLAVHIALLVRLGVPLLEHLWLADLAADRCLDPLLVVGGLAVQGATGSPVNPIAIG